MDATTQTLKPLPKLPDTKRQACPLRLALRTARRPLNEAWIEHGDRYAGLLVEEASGLIDLLRESQRSGAYDPRLLEDRGLALLCRMEVAIDPARGASSLIVDLLSASILKRI